VQTRQQSSNYLLNGGFDEIVTGSVPYWTTSGSVQNYTAATHKGMGSLGLRLTSSVSTSSAYQYVYLDEGEYYLSMYIDTYKMKSGKVYLKAESTISSHTVIREIPTNEYQAAPAYVAAGLKLTAAPSTSGGKERFKISIVVSGTVSETEDVWIDSVMLARATGAAEYDMLKLGHFEASNMNYLPEDFWEYTYDDGTVVTVDSGIKAFGDVLKVDVPIGELSNSVSQTINLTTDSTRTDYDNGMYEASAPRLFTLSDWGKGTSQTFSGDGLFELRAVLSYDNGSSTPVTDTHYIKFDKNIRDWQFASGIFKEDQSKGLLESITIEIHYINNAGIGYFDNISLITDSDLGAVHLYNEAGLVAYSQVGNNSTWYQYNLSAGHVNPVKVISSQKTIQEYDYNSAGMLIYEKYSRYTGNYSALTDNFYPTSSVIYPVHAISYVYNEYGQEIDALTQTTGAESRTFTAYNTTAGSHIFGTVSSETDALGNVTNYFYDSNNGRLLATTYPEGNGVSYTYDGMGNLIMVTPAQVSASGGYSAVSNSSSVIYRYNSATNRLDDIFTDSTTYSFTYDSFGNTTEISAGNHELANYEYNANNGKLSVLTYGNGKKVKYIYDVLDRISEIQYNTSGSYQTAYKYTYDTAGNLFSVEDLLSGENTVFKYDESGRLLSSYVYDADTFKNLYGTSITYDDQQRVSLIQNTLDYSVGSSAYSGRTSYSYTYSTQNGFLSSWIIN
jgi:YD repeat-containing protein